MESADIEWGGSGSALAGKLDNDGEVVVEVSPYDFIVLSKHISER